MKQFFSVFTAILVAGVIFVGCQQPTTDNKPKELSKASAPEQAKANAGLEAFGKAFGALFANTAPAGFSFTGSTVGSDPAVGTYAITFTDYAVTTDAGVSSVTGTMNMTTTMYQDTHGSFVEKGDIVITGAAAAKISIDMTVTFTADQHTTSTGTVTVDGTAYTFTESM